jgi:uncharacterized membrane protein YqjE
MANDLQTRPEPSVASLVSGIVQDAQDLLKQQLNLFSSELRQDVAKAKEAALELLLGGVVCLIGALVLALTAAKLLFWLFPQYLSEWGCYGIVGVVFVATGAALLARSRQALHDVTVDQTVTGLKENVEWKTNLK